MSTNTSTSSLRIRAITAFLPFPDGVENKGFEAGAEFARNAKGTLEEAGFEVQGCRIGTNCCLDYNAALSELLKEVKRVDQLLEKHGLILNMGPTSDPGALGKIPSLVDSTKNIFFHFALPTECAWDLLEKCAQTILQISSESGVNGNFRFAVSSQCPPYIPYFPASYAYPNSTPSFAIGLESSGLLSHLSDCTWNLQKVQADFQNVLNSQLKAIEDACFTIEKDTGFQYHHIDCSLCPNISTPPLTSLWHKFGISKFGQAGTLSVCSALTNALKSIQVKLGGFSGLMLPVCEDAGLVQAANDKSVGVSDLLYYSTVCACGLDCVPVAGYGKDPGENRDLEVTIAAHLMDLHSIAVKLKKPLSCRLLPVAGKKAGEKTNFNFPHLLEANIMEL